MPILASVEREVAWGEGVPVPVPVYGDVVRPATVKVCPWAVFEGIENDALVDGGVYVAVWGGSVAGGLPPSLHRISIADPMRSRLLPTFTPSSRGKGPLGFTMTYSDAVRLLVTLVWQFKKSLAVSPDTQHTPRVSELLTVLLATV